MHKLPIYHTLALAIIPISLIANDIFVDNDEAETDVAEWDTSSYWDPHYGSDYSYNATGSGSDKMRWRPTIPYPGEYEVAIRLPYGDDLRATNAPFTVYHNGGQQTITVNQQVDDSGTWIVLGNFDFAAGTSGYVELTDNANNTYVIGDVVRFIPNDPPPASGPVIVENTEAETTGSDWGFSTNRDNYSGENYSYSATGSGADRMRWRPNLPAQGTYLVELTLPNGTGSWASNAPFTIYHQSGSTPVAVDQQNPNGGVWFPIGTYPFDAGTTGYVELTDDGDNNHVIGDAVRFTPVAGPIMIENTDTESEPSGSWGTSEYQPGYTGDNYSYASTGNGSSKMRWRPSIITPGSYEVEIHLPKGDNSRATNAPFTVYYDGGSYTETINQDINDSNGVWITLAAGPFPFAVGDSGYVELTNDANNDYVIADSVRFTPAVGGDNFGQLFASSSDAAIRRAEPSGPIDEYVIFDTDMGADVDDAGALALLHHLADLGEAEILATIYSSGVDQYADAKYNPGQIDAINTWYGRPDIPIGAGKGSEINGKAVYGKNVAQKPEVYGHDVETRDDVEDSIEVYRQILNRAPNNSVVVVTEGMPFALQQILQQEPTLVQDKIKSWVAMGGRFAHGQPSSEDMDEPNKTDPNFEWNGMDNYLANLLEDWPDSKPAYFFIDGGDTPSGGSLADTPSDNPVRVAFEDFKVARPGKFDGLEYHVSYDQIAALFAVRGNSQNHFNITSEYNVWYDGSNDKLWRSLTGETKFKYVDMAISDADMTVLLDDYMSAAPQFLPSINSTNLTTERVGRVSGEKSCLVLPFQLPDLNGGSMSDATLTIKIANTTSTTELGNLDLYAYQIYDNSGSVDTNHIVDGSRYVSPYDFTLVDDNFISNSDISAGEHSSGDISSFLNECYAAGAEAGDYVYFVITLDQFPSSNQSVEIETSDGAFKPTIDYVSGP